MASISSAGLSSPAFFTPALFALQDTTQNIAISTARLSSGNRLYRIGDDVASFSIASRMQSQIVGLKQAANNVVQGDSMLQVASGALTQIGDVLDRMKAIATQSNSSAITATDRGFLQTEFEQLLSEVDRIAQNTEFNGIRLLDGTLSGENEPETTSSNATKATGYVTFNANPTAGLTVVLGGVTFTAAVAAATSTQFTIGGSTEATIDNLVTVLNASTNTAISQATYAKQGTNIIRITHDSGGALGNQYIIDKNSSTANITASGGATNATNVYTLSGGLNDGLNLGSTVASGTIGDTLVNTQSQTKASVTLAISGTVSNGELLRIDNGNGGTVNFTFATTASAATDIQIGADTAETLRNAIDTIVSYRDTAANTDTYVLKQLDFTRNGSQLVITNKIAGNPTDLAAAAPDVTETLANGVLSAATITGGTTTGVNVTGVNNADFIGEVQGFTASYVGADSITASITVGSHTYTAAITDTTPGSNTTTRFTSTNGGYFDVQLASTGMTVSNASDATTYASRLNAAFAGLTFYQRREVSNFSATGDFVGAEAHLQLADFSEVRINDIQVTAPSSVDGTIDITINGNVFRSASGIGGKLGAYESLKFTSLENGNNVLTLTNGATEGDFSTDSAAADFEEALRSAFGLDETATGVNFQVGERAADKINVVVATSTVSQLFNGDTPSVDTALNAASAETTIDSAMDSLLDNISNVAALQERFQIAGDVISSTLEGLGTAYSNLADTDIAAESTAFATSQLKLNAAVAVIAQATSLQSSLLGILQNK